MCRKHQIKKLPHFLYYSFCRIPITGMLDAAIVTVGVYILEVVPIYTFARRLFGVGPQV